MEPDDRDAVTAIYAEGIATGQATFETDVPPWEGWFASRLPWSRLVALDPAGAVTGWISAVRKSPRACCATRSSTRSACASVLGHAPLQAAAWVPVVATSPLLLAAEEGRKALVRRRLAAA